MSDSSTYLLPSLPWVSRRVRSNVKSYGFTSQTPAIPRLKLMPFHYSDCGVKCYGQGLRVHPFTYVGLQVFEGKTLVDNDAGTLLVGDRLGSS